jgi:uncharacterized caspase-like protein
MTALSVHLGLNKVDPAAYNGWDGALRGCIADAEAMAALAKAVGFTSTTVLLDEEANGEALKEALTNAAALLSAGDTLFLTYSGHGSQIDDEDNDESDYLDETWCLYGSQWLDDETRTALEAFQRGVRVIVFSDSCHSGSVTRGTPAEAIGQRYAEEQPRGELGASVLLISGCQDNQTSGDTKRGGVFTRALLEVWRDGAFNGTWRQFHRSIRRRIRNPAQKPVLDESGPISVGWLDERPFTLTRAVA